jgi:hypothetical protein
MRAGSSPASCVPPAPRWGDRATASPRQEANQSRSPVIARKHLRVGGIPRPVRGPRHRIYEQERASSDLRQRVIEMHVAVAPNARGLFVHPSHILMQPGQDVLARRTVSFDCLRHAPLEECRVDRRVSCGVDIPRHLLETRCREHQPAAGIRRTRVEMVRCSPQNEPTHFHIA